MANDAPTNSFTCASCGAPLDPDGPRLVCAHCGTFQQEVAPSDRDGDVCVRRGVEACQRGDYHFAVKELEEALNLPLKRYMTAEVLTILGNACDNLDRYSQAIVYYQRAIAADPMFYKAWVGLGVTQRHNGDLAAAERCYREAMHIEPEYAELHASLGVLDIQRGESAAAIEALEEAIRLNPSLAIAHGNLALAYAMARRFDAADRALRHAIVLGYHNYQSVQERITALKALEYP